MLTCICYVTGEGDSGEPGSDELLGHDGGELERRRTEKAVDRHRNSNEAFRFAARRTHQWARQRLFESGDSQ